MNKSKRLVDEFAVALAPTISSKFPELLDGKRSNATKLGRIIYSVARGIADTSKAPKYSDQLESHL